MADVTSRRDEADAAADGERSSHDIELAIVTMRFDAADPAALLAVLSKYVVLTRMQPGCRNIDLCASVTHPGRYLLIQKWDSPGGAAGALRQRGDGRDGQAVAPGC